MDERRLAAVLVFGGREPPKTSTAYVLAPRLLLTAAHAVESAGKIKVQLIDQANPMPCTVIWNGRAHDLDAALLEVDASYWPSDVSGKPVRFGRLATLNPGTPAETIGFPAAQRALDGELETAHVYGHVNPGDRLLAGRWVLTIVGTSPEDLGPSPWTGISGAPLFSGDLLCGVVVVDPPHWRHGKLDAVQAHRLLQNKEFHALLRERMGYSPVAEAVELASLAEPATLSRPPLSLPELIRPQAETVRFLGREGHVAEFHAWCQGGGVKARLLIGPGGQGKTRFARELARELAVEGWVVAQLRDSAQTESYKILGEVGPHLLLIMDYADTRPGSVAEVMRVLEEGSKGAVRILLIARSAGEWWDQLPASASAYVSLLSGADVVQLDVVANNLSTRQRMYREALLDLATGLQRLPDYSDIDWESIACALPAPDLSDARLGSPLTLQIRALTDLLAVHPQAQPSQPGSTVEALLLAHEGRYWTRSARRRLLLGELGPDELGDAVAAATLTRVSGKDRAIEVLARVPRLSGLPGRVRAALAVWVSDLYPASTESYWGALEPDRLGEYHVSARIKEEPGFIQEFLPVLQTDEAVRALTVLARAGVQPVCPCPDLLEQVAALIDIHPERLAVPAALVATQSENPDFLIKALTNVATRSDLSMDLLDDLNTAFPAQTAGLAEPALNIATCLVRANRQAVQRAWLSPRPSRRSRASRPSPEDAAAPPTPVSARTAARADLARAYHNYSHRLMGLGKWDEATTAGEHAIGIYRRLARRHPRLYQPFLAGSLDNQAIALNSANRLEEALRASQQARAVHRVLAAGDSDERLVGLARSLSSVSEIFARLGAHKAALNTSTEAVTILAKLADRKPGLYLPELANALHNQANHYAQGAWFDEAETASRQAVAIRRRLAVQRPDANLPGLAHSLHNFSLDLIATEKEVEASKILDESIPLYLRLTLDKGSSYLPYLANALNSKAVQSRDGTKLREAAIASARSVVIYMQLARERPSDFQADLAVALRNHRWALLDAGLVKPAKWDTVLREASEMTQRELPRKAQPPKGQTLKEDEEIRKLANEVVSVNAVDLGEAWAQANATLERHRIRISTSEMGSSPPRDFAKRIRPVWLTPRRWLRRGHLGQKRQWADTTKGMLTPNSVIKRASLVFRYRASKFSDRQEDPRETLDYLYQQQLEALTRIRGGATDLATARRLVEMQLEHLRHKAKLQGQAMRTQELDTEDIAARKEMQDQIAELESQYRALRADEAKVTTLSQRVQTKVNAFRTLNQVFKATYTATDAQREIGLMLYGLSKETSISGMTMQRAQDRNTHMQARAGMVNELIVPGTFDDVNGPPSEYIQPVLDRVDADIDAELKRPKGKINGDPASATDARIGDSKSASATDQPQTGNAHDRPNSE